MRILRPAINGKLVMTPNKKLASCPPGEIWPPCPSSSCSVVADSRAFPLNSTPSKIKTVVRHNGVNYDYYVALYSYTNLSCTYRSVCDGYRIDLQITCSSQTIYIYVLSFGNWIKVFSGSSSPFSTVYNTIPAYTTEWPQVTPSKICSGEPSPSLPSCYLPTNSSHARSIATGYYVECEVAWDYVQPFIDGGSTIAFSSTYNVAALVTNLTGTYFFGTLTHSDERSYPVWYDRQGNSVNPTGTGTWENGFLIQEVYYDYKVTNTVDVSTGRPVPIRFTQAYSEGDDCQTGITIDAISCISTPYTINVPCSTQTSSQYLYCAEPTTLIPGVPIKIKEYRSDGHSSSITMMPTAYKSTMSVNITTTIISS